MDLFAFEEDSIWKNLPENPVEKVLATLQNNPFSRFDEMQFVFDTEWERYDYQKAITTLTNNIPGRVALRTANPHYVGGHALREDWRNTMGVSFNHKYLDNEKTLKNITEYLKQWRKVLPRFYRASATAEDRENHYLYNVLELLPLPDCFDSVLGWYHIVSPSGYKEFYTPEDLRYAPAYEVEELDDGSFALMAYPHPLEFAAEENTNRLVELTTYLYEKWQENCPEEE